MKKAPSLDERGRDIVSTDVLGRVLSLWFGTNRVELCAALRNLLEDLDHSFREMGIRRLFGQSESLCLV